MQKASRSKLEEWIEDGIAEESGLFASDLIAVHDLYARVPPEVCSSHGKPTLHAFSRSLARAGGTLVSRQAVGRRPSPNVSELAGSPKEVRLYSVRRHEIYAGLANAKLAELFWSQRAKAEHGAAAIEFLAEASA